MERRKFTKKFKLEVVQAYLQRGPDENQITIAARYQLHKSAVSNWIAAYGGQVTRSTLRGKPERKVSAPPAAGQGRHTLAALANVVNAIEPLGGQDRRTVIEAVLGLLPP